mgnify:CR=1 FL=1
MTGPAPGKLRVKDAKVILTTPAGIRRLDDAEVYIHVKGWTLARVTHLDIEHPELNNYLPLKITGYYPITGTGWSLRVILDKLIKGLWIDVESELLSKEFIKYGEKSWVYLGSKIGGIFLGFRKEYVRRLEKIAEKYYGISPKKRKQ